MNATLILVNPQGQHVEIDRLLENLGNRLVCLSLTEKMDISPMWAHYADNSRGFVIAMATDRKSDIALTQLDINMPQEVADFIVEHFSLD